ncbi:transglutaminase-like domain-containing protein [Alicyclobacillus vulcanalis]|uniref:Transglutaminase-like superfamily protein n=1 Tax=Alicyclobacillus vulcanalis TaxID=252246 RepID=A0A1N7P2E1_9BACL|nr:transglutaminase-like domain-containing protein [Alicyclobacillus vulcanalis]SIT04825.1 Transglutaminase-like superfamily protein [Alicyclobacillus vulcanalis]
MRRRAITALGPLVTAWISLAAFPQQAAASADGARGALAVPGVGQVAVAWQHIDGRVYAPLSACVAWLNLMHIPQALTSSGWVVGDLPSFPQSLPKTGPLYIWYWQPAHGDEVTYGGPIDAHVIARNGQLYVDVDALRQLFAAFHVATEWQGAKFAALDPVPPLSIPSSGVAPTAAQAPGDLWPEPWFYGEPGVTSSALYNPLTPALPIRLQTPDGFTGEAFITVRSNDDPSETHSYSAPMVHGRLDTTIRLPFQGTLEVQVEEVLNATALQRRTIAYSRAIESAAPSLGLQALGLLQSWFINANESPAVAQLASSIVKQAGITRAQTPQQVDAEIRAISDWASQNIWYNWPAYLNNQVPWQQMTTTLALHRGVCQDISGVAAGLLRALGIPALVIQGQGLGELGWGPHQWDEAWDGARWVTFDPTFDAVYLSDRGVAPPSSVRDTDFDPPPSVFAQNHRGGEIADW